MIRQAPHQLFRASLPLRSPQTRRFLSTAPPAQKSRSWKSRAARLGLAIGVVYYYNTSNLFAEEPSFSIPPPQIHTEDTALPTLESIAPKRNQQPPPPSSPPPAPSTASMAPVQQGLEETEAEASQEGAFNEETGEINWDCPCLGGMAHGPCGEQFRAAFSCFVYSNQEPKGMDCIPNFKTMQDCFREHPDVYGAELEDDEAPEDAPAAPEGGAVPIAATSATPESQSLPPIDGRSSQPPIGKETQSVQATRDHAGNRQPEPSSESDELVPKAAFDATKANVAN